jgi:hypothetical protein
MKDMAIAWVLTLPAAALIAYVLAKFAAFTHPVVAYACCAASVAGSNYAATCETMSRTA